MKATSKKNKDISKQDPDFKKNSRNNLHLKEQKQKYFIKTLERGLSIISLLSSSEKGIGVTEVAKTNNINHTTAIRYLYTLKELGFVVQDTVTKKYQLTPKIFTLGVGVAKNMSLRSRIFPYMNEVTKDLNVTTQCTILQETEIVYVERIRSGDVVNLDLTVGSRLPVYCTAMGKAMLAFIAKEEAKRIIGKIRFEKHTPYTITNKKEFLKELELTRRRGFSINNQELTLGLKTYAIPIFSDGEVEGAFGVSMPLWMGNDKEFERSIVNRMKEIARKTSM